MKRLLLIAAAAAFAFPAAASADTIAYVKGGDLWVANPDGDAAARLTKTGGYSSPSIDDKGVIVAIRGGEIVRVDQNGAVLSHFAPAGSGDLRDVAVSPDGTKVAFVRVDPGCSCLKLRYSASDHSTALGAPGVYGDPSWIDDDTVLAFGDRSEQVAVDSLSDNAGFTTLFTDANAALVDGEVGGGGKLALVRSQLGGVDEIALYPDGSDTESCGIIGDDVDSPTWSPDGSRLAYGSGSGIEVVAIGDLTTGDCSGVGSPKILIAAGDHPDWSKAKYAPTVKQDEPTEQQPPPDQGGGKPGTQTPPPPPPPGNHNDVVVNPPPPPPPPPAPGAVTLTLGKAKLAKALSGGVPVTVNPNGAGRVTVTLTLSGKVAGTAQVDVSAGGARKVTVKLNAAAKKKLKKKKSAKLSVAATFAPSSGAAAGSAKATLTLKR